MSIRAAFILCTLALSACGGGGVKETLGLTHKAPDEFRVVSRPPLSVPPEFTLNPPMEGDAVTGSATPAHKEAEALVFGSTGANLAPGTAATAIMPVTTSALSSAADAQFLKRAGSDRANPAIRETLRQDRGDTEEEKTFLQKLREPGKNEPLVDASGEAARLKADKEAGKPVTEGETPTTKARDTGVLGKIFGY